MTRKMKDSGIEWIGEIPEDWEISKFKNSSNLYVGDSIKDNEKDNYLDKDDAKAYVATKDLIIDENMVDFSNTLYVKNDNLKFKTAPKGSSLICIEGGSAGRKKAFLDRDVCFVNKLCCINPLNSMDKKYMFYLISNQAFEQEFDKYIQGLIGGVSINKLSNFNIPLPTLKEQHKISSFLDNEVNKINISIGYIYEQIENLKNYKKSAITEAVTKGLDKNVEMKDSGIEWIGEIPKHWDDGKTLFFLKMPITDGPHTTPNLYDEGIPFVSAEAVASGNGKIDFNKIRGYISEEFYLECCKKYIPKKDDIYMIKSGATTGLSAMVDTDKKFTIWSPLAVFRADNLKIRPRLLFYILQSKYYLTQVELYWNYGTQQNIGMRTLEKLRMFVPPLKEQNQIADYLNKKTKLIDDSIAIKQKQLETLEEYKKSLIYEYVTGKKEVNDGEES